MSRKIVAAFGQWIEAGGEEVGEIRIFPQEGGGYRLMHVEDAQNATSATGEPPLETFDQPGHARQIALYDDGGQYRPLKTAANLRRGWQMTLPNLNALYEALDFFYPSLIGVWHAQQRLKVVPLRGTLERQSGMYAVTRKTSTEGAQAVINQLCRGEPGCLKKILWEIEPGKAVDNKDFMKSKTASLPLLCNEACNLLVAAIREEVKKG